MNLLGKKITLRRILGMIAGVVIIGIGIALFSAPNNNAIMGAVPKRYYSLATSMLGTVRHVGQVI